ncbi:MAG: hypothetical protein GQ544_05395 [Candidatus Aminicenantes bacterium]|nr:hypothetical protein [Candidatus Aminicenantes bacterium]
MSVKKTMILLGAFLILAMGSVIVAENPQNQDRNQQQAQKNATNMFQNRVLFIDENGDGICDYGYHLGNGNGSKAQKGNRNQSKQTGEQKGTRSQNGWNRQSFGGNRNGIGTGLRNGQGPKGQKNGPGGK